MQWSDVSARPSERTLRQFAALWLLFFAALAGWQLWGRGNALLAGGCLVLALTAGPVGLLWPRGIRWLFVAWMVLAFPVGWCITQVVLAVLFFGLFTPLALLFRLCGRDGLDRSTRPNAGSYWTIKPAPADKRRYLRQF